MRFDTILKTLFQSSGLLLLELTDAPIREWINVEIPKTQMNKLDLVAWLADGRLYHLELQSANDPNMAWRMLEYYFLLWRRYSVQPVQQVIYVGAKPMAMNADIRHERLTFGYRAIDIRELDSEVMLRSAPASQRVNAMSQLLVLSGLRKLEYVIEEESERMPITMDLMENRVIRDYFLRGKREEAVSMLTRLLERRFGPLTEDAIGKVSKADLATLEEWSLRLLDSHNLEDVLAIDPLQ